MGKITVVAVFFVLSLLVVYGAPISVCPPGGTYFDKHLGQYGRWQCCSEICRAPIFKATCEKKCPNYDQDVRKSKPKPPAADTSSAEEDDSSHVAAVISVVVPVAVLLIIGVIVFGVVKRGWFKGVSPVRPLGNQGARQQMGGATGGQERQTGPQERLLSDTATNLPDDSRNIVAGRGDNATREEAAGSSSGISNIAQSEGNLSSRSQQQGATSGDYQTAKETGISVQVVDSSGSAVALH